MSAETTTPVVEGASVPATETLRVLVLDDDELVQRLIAQILEKAGCLVQAASDGRAGLQLLLSSDFDVAVVDLRMEGMDGPTFLAEAKRICPWLGVLVVTGFISSDVTRRLAALGVHEVLTKPFDVAVLRERVYAQAAEKRRKLKNRAEVSLQQIQHALSLFQELGRSAAQSETLLDALRSLRVGLDFLHAEVVGILSLEEEPTLLLFLQAAVGPDFLRGFERNVRARYLTISGKELARDLRVQREGVPPADRDEAPLGMFFSVPILLEGEIRGLLCLGADAEDAFNEADMLFVYHAANLLGTVLLTYRRMRYLAVRDGLTGLYNQRGVTEQLRNVWELARRYRTHVSIAMLDVDYFKQVNDSHGHPTGDEVLRGVARLVSETVRASDIVARYGGDEMIIIFPNTAPEDLHPFCERLRHAVSEHVFCAGTFNLKLTISVGLSSSQGEDGEPLSSEEVIAQADRALYLAKERGRNRVCIWSRRTGAPELFSHAPPQLPAEAGSPAARADVLVVDDDPSICSLLSRVLTPRGFAVTAVVDVESAIQAVTGAQGRFDLVVTDLSIDEQASGFDLMTALRRIDPTLVAVVMTGHATLDNAVRSLRHGAYDFVQKPIEPAHLVAVLERALEYRRLRRDNQRYQSHLEEMVREKSRELSAALEVSKRSNEVLLEALMATLDARERSTRRHSASVRELAVALARELGVEGRELEDLSQGALLHDIGKISIPDAILLKNGPLTADEWVIMRTHAEVGYRIVRISANLAGAAEIVRAHHEWYDGSGYPRGLRGEAILLGARVFAVVDAFDAMRSDRPYRKGLSMDQVVMELRRGSGSQFDPRVVEVALRILPEFERIRESVARD